MISLIFYRQVYVSCVIASQAQLVDLIQKLSKVLSRSWQDVKGGIGKFLIVRKKILVRNVWLFH